MVDSSKIELMYQQIANCVFDTLFEGMVNRFHWSSAELKKCSQFLNDFPKMLRQEHKRLAKNTKQFPVVVIFSNDKLSKYFEGIDEIEIFDYGYAIFSRTSYRMETKYTDPDKYVKTELVFVRDTQAFDVIRRMSRIYLLFTGQTDTTGTLFSKSTIVDNDGILTFMHSLSNVIYEKTLCNTVCEIKIVNNEEYVNANLTIFLRIPDLPQDGTKFIDVWIENETVCYRFEFPVPNLPKFEECFYV